MLLNIRSDLWKGLINWQPGSALTLHRNCYGWMLLERVDQAQEK